MLHLYPDLDRLSISRTTISRRFLSDHAPRIGRRAVALAAVAERDRALLGAVGFYERINLARAKKFPLVCY